MKKMISRRNFLKAAGVSAAALGLAACGGSSSSTAASTANAVPLPHGGRLWQYGRFHLFARGSLLEGAGTTQVVTEGVS